MPIPLLKIITLEKEGKNEFQYVLTLYSIKELMIQW